MPFICGLSRVGAVQCGARHPFGLGASLVEADLDDLDEELAGATVEGWMSAWRAVRGAAPELRGYVSIRL